MARKEVQIWYGKKEKYTLNVGWYSKFEVSSKPTGGSYVCYYHINHKVSFECVIVNLLIFISREANAT